jgi:hypothetical protein
MASSNCRRYVFLLPLKRYALTYYPENEAHKDVSFNTACSQKDMILTAFIVLECGTESRGGSDVNGDNFFAVQSLDAHSKGCTGVISGYRTRRIQDTILLLGFKR